MAENKNMITKPKPPSNFLLVFLLFFPLFGMGQKWIADTLTIALPDPVSCFFNVETATDLRTYDPRFLSVYEQNKWLVFPVDQIVAMELPLNKYFENRFSSDSNTNQNYLVNIREFYIKNSSTKSKRNLKLYSTLELSKKQLDDTIFVGSFYYEEAFTHKKKLPVVEGYESLLEEWSNNFISDVLAVDQELDLILGNNLYHFRRNKTSVKKNLYTELDFFAGLNFWGIDGEIWFSEPEGNKKFNRSAGVMRYVKHPNFQSIGLGRNLRFWNYRMNEKWLFTNKMAFVIGFNNWNDMDTAAHKFEEIFLFDLSFTQRINYNPIDKSGFVFGLGLMEDVHYIIYHQPKLNIGLSVNIAYKF